MVTEDSDDPCRSFGDGVALPMWPSWSKGGRCLDPALTRHWPQATSKEGMGTWWDSFRRMRAVPGEEASVSGQQPRLPAAGGECLGSEADCAPTVSTNHPPLAPPTYNCFTWCSPASRNSAAAPGSGRTFPGENLPEAKQWDEVLHHGRVLSRDHTWSFLFYYPF